MSRFAVPLLIACALAGFLFVFWLPPGGRGGSGALALFIVLSILVPLRVMFVAIAFWRQVLMHRLRGRYFAGWRAALRSRLAVIDPMFIVEVWRHQAGTGLQARMKKVFVLSQCLALAGLAGLAALLVLRPS